MAALVLPIDHSHERSVSLVRVSPLAEWYVSRCSSTKDYKYICIYNLWYNRGECTVISLNEH